MKRAMALVLSLVLFLSSAVTFAEGDNLTFEQMTGLEWSFCSGVGAWSTEIQILADGSFSGLFHDGEHGEVGDGYPDGTIYVCTFSGRMTLPEPVDEYSWRVHVDELTVDEEAGQETIADGVRFVTSDPYGISEGDDMLLYRPGTPVEALSEDMQMWAHLFDLEERPSELETWFLSSEKNDSGFVGYPTEDWPSAANPWEDVTAEQLTEETGLSFGVPEGAEDVVYRLLRSEGMAEMQFTWEECEFCARIQPASLQDGELLNISGMYFAWENEEEVSVGHCRGTIGQAKTGSEEWVELCLWYDAAPGLMYSLSMYTAADPDGLDLAAVAESVYLPAQGDA